MKTKLMIIPYVTCLKWVKNAPVVSQEALEEIIFHVHQDLSNSPVRGKAETGAFLLGYTGAFWQFHFDGYMRDAALTACVKVGVNLHDKLGHEIPFCIGAIHPCDHIVVEMVRTIREAVETCGFGNQLIIVIAPRYALNSNRDILHLYERVCKELKDTEIRIAIYNNPNIQGQLSSRDKNLSETLLEEIIKFDKKHEHRLVFIKDSSGEILGCYEKMVNRLGVSVQVLQGNIPAAFDKAMFGEHGTVPSDAQVFPVVYAELMLVLFGQEKVENVADYSEKYKMAQIWRGFNQSLGLSDQMKTGYVLRRLGYVTQDIAGEAPLNSNQEKHLDDWFCCYSHYLLTMKK